MFGDCLCCEHRDEGKSYESQEIIVAVQLSKLKNELATRETRILLLVVRHKRVEEDESMLTEKFSRAVKKLGVDNGGNRTVYLLTTTDFKNSMRRLESLLYELSGDYYKQQIKRLKSYKTKVSKSSQPKLYCRHHFKIAYFNEIINDIPAALKYYNSSYSYLKQIPHNPSSLFTHEIKAVSLVLNLKVCRLLLISNRFNDAVEQFSQHITYYKKLIGLNEILFQHYQSLSQQYQLFADLLESHAQNKQNTKNATISSGYYYQTAAHYAVKRKYYAVTALEKNKSSSLDIGSIGSKLAPPAYLGQARLLTNNLGGLNSVMSTNSTNSEYELTRSILHNESNFDHSNSIIQLLNRAYESFKREKNDRMILAVASNIAIEYFHINHYEMAKKFFDRIAVTYRDENWHNILTQTLLVALKAAQKLNRTQDAVNYSLELLGKYSTATLAQRTEIYRSLITNEYEPQTDIFPEIFDSDPKFALITANYYFFTSKSSPTTVYLKQQLQLCVEIAVNLPEAVTADRIHLNFNQSGYNFTLLHDPGLDNAAILTLNEDNECRANLNFNSAVPKLFKVTLNANHTTISATKTSISGANNLLLTHLITHLNFGLKLKTEAAVLKSSAALLPPQTTAAVEHNKSVKTEGFQEIDLLTSSPSGAVANDFQHRTTAVRISAPNAKAKLSVDHPQPQLLNEYYPINITINSHKDLVKQPKLSISFVANTASNAFPVAVNPLFPEENKSAEAIAKADTAEMESIMANAHFYTLNGGEMAELTSALALPQVATNATHTVTIYAKFSSLQQVNVLLALEYSNADAAVVSTSTNVILQAKPALRIKFKVICDSSKAENPSYNTNTAIQVVRNKLCLLHVEVENVSGHLLGLWNFDLALDPTNYLQHKQFTASNALAENTSNATNRHFTHADNDSNTPSIILAAGERFTNVFYFTPLTAGHSKPNHINMNWIRVHNNTSISSIILPNPANIPIISHKRPAETCVATAAAAVADGLDKLSNNLERELAGVFAEAKQEQLESAAESGEAADNTVAISRKTLQTQPELETTVQELVNEQTNTKDDGTGLIAVNNDAKPVALVQAIPSFSVIELPIDYELIFPPTVVFGEKFELTIKLSNRSARVEEVEINVDTDFSAGRLAIQGGKINNARIFPSDHYPISYTIIALECGFITLPKIIIKSAVGVLSPSSSAVAAAAAAVNDSTPSSVDFYLDVSEQGVIFVQTRSRQPN
jgi:hypothetical protein